MIGVLVLLVLAVAVVFIGPSFYDWNSEKARISRVVRDLTGRDVKIDGDVSLTLLPSPKLTAKQISLANIPGASAETMARVRELELQVALLPLIQGQFQVQSFSLIGPEIALEILPDGRRNWEFAFNEPKDAPARNRESAAGDEGLRYVLSLGSGFSGHLRLDNFTVTEGTLIYKDPYRQEVVENLNAQIAADSVQGPFAASGTGRLRGIDGEFRLALGRLRTEGASTLDLGLDLPDGRGNFQFNGALSRHTSGLSLRGRVKADAPDASALLALFRPLEASARRRLALPLHAESDILVEADALTARETVLRVGDTTLNGQLQTGLSEPYDFVVDVTSNRIDLDSLLRGPKRGGDGEEEAVASDPNPEPEGQSSNAGQGNRSGLLLGLLEKTLPPSLTGRFSVDVKALIYRGQVIRQLLLGGSTGRGGIELEQGIALLPGGSDVTLTGAVAPEGDGSRFMGQLEAASDNLRALLTWLGMNVKEVPPDRLRRMSMNSQVAISANQVSANKLDLRVDLSRLTGGVTVALRDRLGLGIGLHVDRLNADAYFPMAPKKPKKSAGGGEVKPQAENPVSDSAFGFLEQFDANLNLSIEEMTWENQVMAGLSVDATLRDGNMTLRELSLEDVGGAALRYQGLATEFSGQVPQVDGALTLAMQDRRRLANLLGISAKALEKIGSLAGNAAVSGPLNNLALEGDIELLEGNVAVRGKVQPADRTFDVALRATHNSFPALLRGFGLRHSLAGLEGPLEVVAEVSGGLRESQWKDFAGSAGNLAVKGKFAADFTAPRPAFDLDLTVGEFPAEAILGLLVPTAKIADGSADAAPRWSRATYDLSGLRQFDASLSLRADALTAVGMRLDSVLLDANLEKGRLDIAQLNGALFGGAILLSGKLETAEEIIADIDLNLFDVDSRTLLSAVPAADFVSGPASISAKLKSQGRSMARIVRNLQGEGTLEGKLTLTPQEAKSGPTLEIFGKKFTQLGNLGEAADTLINAFTGAPVKLSGPFVIEDGVLIMDAAQLEGAAARATGSASVNLPDWLLESRIDVFRPEDTDAPYLTGSFVGPLDEPNVKVKGKPIQH